MHIRPRWLALAALSAALLAAVPAEARGPTAAVSLGDSFISGQAGRWAGNSNDLGGSRAGTDRACVVPTPLGCRSDVNRVYPGGTAPPGCARSDLAEIRTARVGVQQMINIACSGAATKNIFRATSGGERFKNEAPQSDQLAQIAKTHTVKLIVLSIGGNDIGFEDLVVACVLAYATRSRPCATAQQAATDNRLPQAMGGVAKAIAEIRAVMRAAGYRQWNYRIVLQSYPSPVPRASENRYSEASLQRTATGGCPFYDGDLNFARDTLVPGLDTNLGMIATVTGVQFLSLRDAFQGREVCSRTTKLVDNANPPSPVSSEWARAIGVNPILQGRGIDEEAHPNALGQLALGRCVTLLQDHPTGSWTCKNTPGQDVTKMTLSPVSSLPGRYSMKLRVSPRRVRAGRRCFRFRTSSGAEPVEGVTVRFAGKRGKTNSRGRLRKCFRLRARRYRARATRADFRSTSATVRARGR